MKEQSANESNTKHYARIYSIIATVNAFDLQISKPLRKKHCIQTQHCRTGDPVISTTGRFVEGAGQLQILDHNEAAR
jgi:hypothetical protein